jgi:hypothetical protein
MGSRVSTDFRSLSKLSPDRDNLNDFLPQPLSLLPSVFQSAIPTLGLYNGTIYDLLVPNEGVGNVTVNGTAFNITCRYITDVVLSPLQNATSWNVTWPGYAPDYVTIPRTRKIAIRFGDEIVSHFVGTTVHFLNPSISIPPSQSSTQALIVG